MPFLPGFSKRKPIRYGTIKPASNQTAFSLLVKAANDADIGAELSSRKLAVTLADGTTQVGYGAHKFASGGGLADLAIRARFDLDSSAATNDVLGYLYYDATATDQQNKAVAVDSNTQGYWPLEEDPSGSAPQVRDWTSNANHGTSHGSMASGDLVAGQVANGLDFDGSDDQINVGNVSSLNFEGTDAFSGGAWIKLDSTAPVANTIFGKSQGSPLYRGWAFLAFRRASLDSTSLTLFLISNPTTLEVNCGNVLSAGTWYRVWFTYDGSNTAAGVKLYLNGALQTNTVIDDTLSATIQTTEAFRIGFRADDTPQAFDGIIDEVDVSSGVRSADWVAYDYQNQFNNGDTVTLGSEEVASDPRRAQLSFVELQVPNGPRRSRLSFAELQVPNGPRRARLSFSELEVPSGPRRARLSFVELEIPNGPRRARLSFVELELPDVSGIGNKLFGQLSSRPLLGGTLTTQARLAGELSVSC